MIISIYAKSVTIHVNVCLKTSNLVILELGQILIAVGHCQENDLQLHSTMHLPGVSPSGHLMHCIRQRETQHQTANLGRNVETSGQNSHGLSGFTKREEGDPEVKIWANREHQMFQDGDFTVVPWRNAWCWKRAWTRWCKSSHPPTKMPSYKPSSERNIANKVPEGLVALMAGDHPKWCTKNRPWNARLKRWAVDVHVMFTAQVAGCVLKLRQWWGPTSKRILGSEAPRHWAAMQQLDSRSSYYIIFQLTL